MADFGWAMRSMRAGKRVQRAGWNGKNMFIFLRPAEERRIVNAFMAGDVLIEEHLLMRTVRGSMVPWTVSQSDAIAEDWDEVHGYSNEYE